MKVVVVGAGVVGLCAARELVRRGHHVVVVDRGPPEGDRCSLGNSGIIVPSHFVPLAAPGMVAAGLKMMARKDSPFRIKPSASVELARWCLLFSQHCTEANVANAAPLLCQMHLRSRDLFRDLAQQSDNQFGFTEAGMTMVCQTKDGLREEEETAERAAELGLRVEYLDAHRAASRHPGTGLDCLGAIHFADDCHVAPHVFVRTLQDGLFGKVEQWHWNTQVSALTGQSVTTEQGTLSADAVVVAAGTWSGQLAKAVGLDMPLQPGLGISFSLEGPRAVPASALLLKEARVAVTPMWGGVRFGGTMELGEWERPQSDLRARSMVRSICETLRVFKHDDFESNMDSFWVGRRPCSPDGLPYIGPTDKAPGLFFATGHGMMGLSLGPVTGELVADAVEGQSIDKRLSPDRFD